MRSSVAVALLATALAGGDVGGTPGPVLRRPVVNGSGARAVARGELASGPPEAARFLGGGGLFDRVTAMAVDGDDLYVVGETESADFPVTPGAVQPELEGPRDLFVARLDASSLAVEAATFLGGEADERSGGIALGPEDVVYVAGTTTSIDFPAPRPDGGGADAFLVGLTRDLGAVVYAVAPGGVRDDEALALAAGPRYVWLAGATRSAEWGADPPALPGAPERGDLDAFVMRLEPGAGKADAPRRFGGTENDRATAVAISPRGVVVAGTTFSRDLAGWEDAPLTPRHPHQPPGADAFIIAVPQDPGPPFFAVRLGGGATDTAAAVTVDSTGLIHVAGRTSSPDFPTTRDAYDRVLGGQADAFVATLSPAGDLIASTFIGGTSHDEALAVATSGQAVIAAGLTTSSDFPADAAPAFGPGGRTDAFIVGMDAVGLTLARRYGGSGYDDGAALATLGPAAVAVGGATGSHDLATTPGLGDAFPGGLESGWVGIVGVAGGSPRPPQRPTAVLVPGWGGLGDIQTSCAPSLVHHDQGAVSSPGMSVIGDWLVDDGFDVWHAVLDTGPGHTASLEDGAACLARQLADLRRSHPALGLVALVGYSLGGLVARAYVEDDVLFARDISTLVTLGAPHGGIPADGLLALGAFLGLGERVDCATQAGLCEVTSSAIPRFEARHPARRPGVRYAAVSGAIASPDASWLGRALGAWLPGADDGLVQTASGLGLRGPVATGRPPEAHVAQLLGAPLAGRTYFTPAPGRGTSGAYENCLLPILRGAAGCGPGTAAEPDAGAGDRTPVTVATVAAGDSVTMSLPLAPGVGAMVTAAWDRGPMQLEVIGPGDISPGDPGAAPGETLGGDAWRIDSGPGGVWTATVKAGQVAAPARVALVALTDRPRRLTASTDRGWYAPGSTAAITVTVEDLPAPRVVAVVTGPSGPGSQVALAPAGPGVYAAPINVGDTPGFAHVEVQATGRGGAGAPERLAAGVDFQIASRAVRIPGWGGDRAIDRDADGRFEALAIDVGVATDAPRRVAASARLVSLDGVAIAAASKAVTVTGGATVTLMFDGRGIAAARRDGPFLVAGLVEDLGPGPTLPVGPLPAWRTAAYRAADFGPRPRVLVPVALVPARPPAPGGLGRWP